MKKLYQQLKKEAEESGYLLNPDEQIAKELVRGLLVNENRYGYWACPCRLADGDKQEDIDIICPCDYRDEDLYEYGVCYCGFYVSKDVYDGKKDIESIKERRPKRDKRAQHQRISKDSTGIGKIQSTIWRCRVCGYLCARTNPPLTCPVCKAKQDRFERFQ